MNKKKAVAAVLSLTAGAVTAIIPELPFDEETIIARVKAAKAAGKRGMIVVVSEGAFTDEGKPYSEYIAKRIEAETGIETKFARFAHVVRGGTPTLRDRLAAAKMGTKAVELLLQGISDVVICSRHDKIVPVDIKWALIVDRMFKGKLKDGDLDSFTQEQIEEMKALCAERRAYFENMYDIMLTIGG